MLINGQTPAGIVNDDLIVNANHTAQNGLKLYGFSTGNPSIGGLIQWHPGESETPGGWMYINNGNQLVFDHEAQATGADTGNAWIDFDTGGFSFSGHQISGNAGGSLSAIDLDISGSIDLDGILSIGKLAAQGTIYLQGLPDVLADARGGTIQWNKGFEGHSNPDGYTYINGNYLFVFDADSQSDGADTGKAWISFNDGSFSFGEHTIRGNASGNLEIDGDLIANAGHATHIGLKLYGFDTSTRVRGGEIEWYKSEVETADGFMFINTSSRLVFDTSEQSADFDAGNAWIDFTDGSFSFSGHTIRGNASGDLEVDTIIGSTTSSDLTITGLDATSGNGPGITLTGGDTSAPASSAGAISLIGGDAPSGNGGSINLTAGTGSANGNINLNSDAVISGDLSFTGAGRFQLPNVTDAGPMTATSGTESEVVYNLANDKAYVCTASGAPGTWEALH